MFWPFSDSNPPQPSPRSNRIIGWFIGVVVVVCVGWFLLGAWKSYHIMKQELNKPVVAKPAPEVAKVQTVEITPAAPIKVYAPEAKAKLKLSKEVQADKNKYVLAASHVAPDDHPHTVTTVIDQQTGETTTYDTKDPLPWLAVDLHGDAGMYYGMKNGYPALRFEAHQNLLDIKAVTVGITATADQMMQGPIQADWFIGVGAAYRW